MKDNIKLELERAGKLDDLQARTDILSENSRQFHVSSKKVKNAYWWKNVKVKCTSVFIFFSELYILDVGYYHNYCSSNNCSYRSYVQRGTFCKKILFQFSFSYCCPYYTKEIMTQFSN